MPQTWVALATFLTLVFVILAYRVFRMRHHIQMSAGIIQAAFEVWKDNPLMFIIPVLNFLGQLVVVAWFFFVGNGKQETKKILNF